jgi:DCN1-like protein 1/2
LLCDLRVCRVKDAKRFIDKYKRVDVAMDAFYNDPAAMVAAAKHQGGGGGPSTSKLNTLFDRYKGS